jgi:hypothetical protein
MTGCNNVAFCNYLPTGKPSCWITPATIISWSISFIEIKPVMDHMDRLSISAVAAGVKADAVAKKSLANSFCMVELALNSKPTKFNVSSFKLDP